MEELLRECLQQQTSGQHVSLLFEATRIIILLLSVSLILWKINRNIKEVSKTHDWNRRKASQEACYEFMRSPIEESWNIVFEPIIIERKKYEELSEEHQKEMRKIMNYFENLGVLIKHTIVDKDIIYDFFQSIWFPCYEATEEYIAKSKTLYKNHSVFENFSTYAKEFRCNSDKLDEARKKAGRTSPKPKITG